MNLKDAKRGIPRVHHENASDITQKFYFFCSTIILLHSIAETEELKQKRINGSYQDLSKLTAETEFRGNGNRINGGKSVYEKENRYSLYYF